MAVVKIAGKQFVVEEGQNITVPYVDLEVGKTLTTKDLLTGKDLDFEVVNQKRGAKVIVLKFRNKTRYLRIRGHKSKLTVLNAKSGKMEVKEEIKKEKVAPKKSSKKEG